jgi:hypothetical protein
VIQANNEVTKYNFSGGIQQGNIVQNSKAYKDDEMYDGGEGEEQTLDQNQIYIDLDKAEENGEYAQIACTRLKRVTDWRLRHKTWFQGYVAKDLRPNDYIFINSMIAAVVFLLLLTITLVVRWNDSFGFIICFPISYIAISLIIGASVIMQSRVFDCKETTMWVIGNAVYLGIGVSWFLYKFDLSDFDTDVNTENVHMVLASYFILFYILMVPTLVHGIFVAARIADRGLEDFTILYKSFLGIFCFGILLMTATIFLFVHWV